MSDRELIRRFGVSLLTARQAMSELVNEGLLERRQGSGTFISGKVDKIRAAEAPPKADTVLFTGWSPAALSGWDAMYFRDIFEGIQKEAAAREFRIAFDDIDARSPEEIVAEARKRRIFGVVALVGTAVRQRCEILTAAGLHVVGVNFQSKSIPCIYPDDYSGGRIAVEHLLKLGHRKLAHINSGEREHHWTEVKRAFCDAISEAGLSLEENPVVESPRIRGGSIEAGYESAQALWASHKPSAIFAGNDLMAIGALKFLRDNRIDVPNQVSVVGFDNTEAAAAWSPALTTISVDRIELGRTAVRMLCEWPFKNADFEPTKMPVCLVERETTSPSKNQ